MNVLTTTWRQLVRRKLWPVAVLLVAALAAVPMVLAKEPEPVSMPADPAPATAKKVGDDIATPIVAMAEAGDRDRRRRVLGGRKDPFEPAPLPKAKKSQDDGGDADKSADGATGTAPGKPVDPGFGTPPSGSSPVVPIEPKPKTYPPDSLVVRFGDATSDSLERLTLRKLEALPLDAEKEPLLVYLRLSKDKKTAVFLVDAAAEATGDGSCKPHPRTCEEIHLRKGETEFLDVVDPESGEIIAQYQLDLVDIKSRKSGASATSAKAARSAKPARKAEAADSAQVAAGI
jgi:hypothetical protein